MALPTARAAARPDRVTGIDFVFVACVADDARRLLPRRAGRSSRRSPVDRRSTPRTCTSVDGDERRPRARHGRRPGPTVDGREVAAARRRRAGRLRPLPPAHRRRPHRPALQRRPVQLQGRLPESQLDCAPPPHECPPEATRRLPGRLPGARLLELRRALLDFAAAALPGLAGPARGRRRRDAGRGVGRARRRVRLHQDRIAREASLETADPAALAAPARAARRLRARTTALARATWLDVTVTPGGGAATSPAGTAVRSCATATVDLRGRPRPRRRPRRRGYAVDRTRATRSRRTLGRGRHVPAACGATELARRRGTMPRDLAFDDFAARRPPGTWVLLRTDPATPAMPARALPVRHRRGRWTTATACASSTSRGCAGRPTRRAVRARPDVLVVRGNLVPATAGETHARRSLLGTAPGGARRARSPAVERPGPDGAVATGSRCRAASERVARLRPSRRRPDGRPEVRLRAARRAPAAASRRRVGVAPLAGRRRRRRCRRTRTSRSTTAPGGASSATARAAARSCTATSPRGDGRHAALRRRRVRRGSRRRHALPRRATGSAAGAATTSPAGHADAGWPRRLAALVRRRRRTRCPRRAVATRSRSATRASRRPTRSARSPTAPCGPRTTPRPSSG